MKLNEIYDWVDQEYERRQAGERRALTQDQHRALNARHPGSSIETCVACGEATGKAGAGEDSLYTDSGEGPFCEQCFPGEENEELDNDDDICGFCNQPGADKIPHPVRWPGEESAGTKYVHAECEDAECQRAHAQLSDKQRERFLRTL